MPETHPEWFPDVGGSDSVFDWFGYWPSFHDAEVLELVLNARGTSSILVHTWETTSEVDDKSHYVTQKHALVRFLLEDVTDLELNGFSPQNVISSAEITRSGQGFRLTLWPCYGLAGSLTAAKISIRLDRGTNVGRERNP